MTHGQKYIKLLAHFTVQKELLDQIVSDNHQLNFTSLKYRKILLDQLEYHGYKRFLINDSFHLDPVFDETRIDAENSWTTKAVYNKSEIAEFLNYVDDATPVLEWAIGNWEITGSYSGPGRSFYGPTYVDQKRNRIVVSCSGGIDC